MTRNGHPTPKLTTVAGSVLAIVAMLALTGSATANRHSHDSDDPAGTIASFDPGSGRLVIDLADGGSISGIVTRYTWIEAGESCESRRARRQLHEWCRQQLHSFEHSGHDWTRGPSGSTDDLIAGTLVDDALLVLKDGRALFAKIELED